ncbi:hypothetical protein KEM48_000777 [Puccinia striiformis f. sp. tritici PST-130]|nr:hypothetical protein KEM48_000777 [Puccinia striiformis f. sp. tritici PST-130]
MSSSNLNQNNPSKTEEVPGQTYSGLFGLEDDADSRSDVDEFEGEDGDDSKAYHYWQVEGFHHPAFQGDNHHNPSGSHNNLPMTPGGRSSNPIKKRIPPFKELKGVTAYDISARRYNDDESYISDFNPQHSPSIPANNQHTAELRPEEKERFEWQDMLTNVLTGEVLRTEKTRISEVSGGKDTSMRQQDASRMSDIWVGLRAYLRCRSVADEQRYLEDARLQMDQVLEDVRKFKVSSRLSKDEAIQRVQSLH